MSLSVGTSGADVLRLQQALKNAGFYAGAVDGKFGRGTAAAVQQFQAAKALTADGAAGPKTLAALGLAGDDFSAPPAAGTPSAATVSGSPAAKAPRAVLKHAEFTADTDGTGGAGGSDTQSKRTTFENQEASVKSGARYLNGDKTPYLAMRGEDLRRLGVKMGDLVKVSHGGAKYWAPRDPRAVGGWVTVPPKEAWAIVGDSRGNGRSANGGEGSPALHRLLGGNGSGLDGTMQGHFEVAVYPGSGAALVGKNRFGGPARIPSNEEIVLAGRRLEGRS